MHFSIFHQTLNNFLGAPYLIVSRFFTFSSINLAYLIYVQTAFVGNFFTGYIPGEKGFLLHAEIQQYGIVTFRLYEFLDHFELGSTRIQIRNNQNCFFSHFHFVSLFLGLFLRLALNVSQNSLSVSFQAAPQRRSKYEVGKRSCQDFQGSRPSL